jgi:phosphonate transport system substrate-binding protein
MVALVAGIGLAFAWFDDYRPEPTIKVDPSVTAPAAAASGDRAVLRVAVSAMTSPAETVGSYRRLVDYLGARLGMDTELVVRKTYTEVNHLIAGGAVDIAFICTGAYVTDRDKGYMELLAAPIVRGQPGYYSYIIVPRESDAASLMALRGKRFAFTDELSNTGCLVPSRVIESTGVEVDAFFKETVFTGSHDKSIQSVARRLVDGAAVDSLILDALREKGDADARSVRIVEKTGPFGMPPVVVRSALAPELKEQLLSALLEASQDAAVGGALREAGIDSFRVPADAEYDSVLSGAPVAERVLEDDQFR